MTNPWEEKFSNRTAWMKSSFIRELLKVTNQPDVISFGGGFPAGAFGHEVFKSLKHRIASFFVNAFDELNMIGQPIASHKLIGDVLVKGRTLQVGTLFGLNHLLDNFFWPNCPTDAQTGS